MDWIAEKECLDNLYRNPQANASLIIRIHQNIMKDANLATSSEVIQFLNENAVKLLQPQVVDILNKNRLEAYSYLLVSNNLLDLEDVKDDLLNGDVLVNAIPANTLRRLKNQLGLAASASSTAIPGLAKLRLTRPIQDGNAHQRQGETLATASTSTLVEHKQTTTTETMVMDWLTSQRENAKTRQHGESLAMASASSPVPVAQPQHPTDTKCILSQHSAVAARAQHIHQWKTGEDNTRLAIKIKDECINLRRLKGNFFAYQLELKETPFTETATFIKRFSFGEPNQLMDKPWKTILLMGGTGSGKTTMINAMINYVLGVNWEDDFRFMLIKEEVRGGNQAHSQTQGVTAYDLHYQNGFRIPFSLTIVDTPGFGDTCGIERDNQITATIQAFFEHPSGIQELDAVGFVVKSSDARLTDSQKYIFKSVLKIFGNDMKDNIRFLVTFSDTEKPLVLDAIKEAKLPCQMDSNESPCHFKFNNGAMDRHTSENGSKWKLSMDSFESFFKELNNMPTQSLQMTKEVLEMRKCLEMQLEFMWGAMDEQLAKIEELRNTEIVIAQNKEKIDSNKNFEIPFKVSKKEKIDNNQSALNCNKCEVTCHYPCFTLALNLCPAFWEFSFSAIPVETLNSMSSILPHSLAKKTTAICTNNSEVVTTEMSRMVLWSAATIPVAFEAGRNVLTPNRTCKVCPGKCPTDDHVNERRRWVYRQVEEKKTLFDMRKRYEEAIGQTLNAEGTLASLKEEIERFKLNIFTAMKEITSCSNLLKSIALLGDSLTTVEYIQLKIDNEQKEKKHGYAERIKSFEDVLKIAKENLAGEDFEQLN